MPEGDGYRRMRPEHGSWVSGQEAACECCLAGLKRALCGMQVNNGKIVSRRGLVVCLRMRNEHLLRWSACRSRCFLFELLREV